MDYRQATRYLISLGNEVRAANAGGVLAAKMGLENISVLLEELGRPQHAFPSVLIGGTNGKGSAAAMLEAVLRSAGLRTGLYTSPHLVEINERIQLCGKPIVPDEFAAGFTSLHRHIERMLAEGRLCFHPTYFECLTAMSMDYFRRRNCEFALLEVGMGGRLDATNTATPLLCVITQIDFDHERFLGTTIEAIAGEKAGIIKRGGIVVSAASRPVAAEVIRRRASEQEARLVEVWREYQAVDLEAQGGAYRFRAKSAGGFSLPVSLSLRGVHQVENAMAVVAASRELSRLGFPVSEQCIHDGLAQAKWPGRLELVHQQPPLFLDGAHNPAGARALARFWDEHFPSRRIILVYGAMRDKAVPEITEILFPRASAVVLTRPEQVRAAAPETIRDICLHLNPRMFTEPSPVEAIERALALAGPDDVIFVTGSLFLVGDVKRECFPETSVPLPEPLAAPSLLP